MSHSNITHYCGIVHSARFVISAGQSVTPSSSPCFILRYSLGRAINHLPQSIHKNIFLQVATAGVPLAISGDVPVIMCN